MFIWLGIHVVADAMRDRQEERNRIVEEANAAGEIPPPRRSEEIRKIVITLPASVLRTRRAERELVRTARESGSHLREVA
jgi:hypothetical protein